MLAATLRAIAMSTIDTDATIARLRRFLAVEVVTGREARIGKELVAALREARRADALNPL